MSAISLLAIGGPTASGKTGLAIDLAQRFGGAIINADSRQVYRGMDIGTAKPTAAERALVPHHLFDIVDPDQEFSLALYTRLAHAAIERVADEGLLPILVGGTGLYLRAVTEGYAVPEVPPNVELRSLLAAQAAANGTEPLLERLRLSDPVAATRIDPHNARRLIRAIEVGEALGVPFSSLQQQQSPYNSHTIVLEGERDVLYSRADARLDRMLADGFVQEVSRLIASGYGPQLPAMSALGYRELGRHLAGEITYDDAVAATRAATRAFIKRQETWFKRERAAYRLPMASSAGASEAAERIELWLKGGA